MTDKNYMSMAPEDVVLPTVSRLTRRNTPANEIRCDFSCVNSFPLGMAYVPMQAFEGLYDLDTAYNAGTLFSALNKEFKGRCMNGGGNF